MDLSAIDQNEYRWLEGVREKLEDEYGFVTKIMGAPNGDQLRIDAEMRLPIALRGLSIQDDPVVVVANEQIWRTTIRYIEGGLVSVPCRGMMGKRTNLSSYCAEIMPMLERLFGDQDFHVVQRWDVFYLRFHIYSARNGASVRDRPLPALSYASVEITPKDVYSAHKRSVSREEDVVVAGNPRPHKRPRESSDSE